MSRVVLDTLALLRCRALSDGIRLWRMGCWRFMSEPAVVILTEELLLKVEIRVAVVWVITTLISLSLNAVRSLDW